MRENATETRYLRFTLSDRLEHWVQVVAFTGLAITGLVQSFSEGRFPKAIITTLGGINSTRFIHRALGVVQGLAVLFGENGGELVHLLFEQLLQAEQDPRAPQRRRRTSTISARCSSGSTVSARSRAASSRRHSSRKSARPRASRNRAGSARERSPSPTLTAS